MERPCQDTEDYCAGERDKESKEVELEEGGYGETEGESDEGGDGDCFFESLDRVPSGVSFGLDHLSSNSDTDDDVDDDDVRISFASAIEAPRFSICVADFDDYIDEDAEGTGGFDYDIWMTEPISLSERRRRLRHGMGLRSSKNLTPSKSHRNPKPDASHLTTHCFPPPLPPSAVSKPITSFSPLPDSRPRSFSESPLTSISLVRSFSYSHLPCKVPAYSGLLRSFSSPPSPWFSKSKGKKGEGFQAKSVVEKVLTAVDSVSGGDGAGLCKIKNLDTGKEFVMSEVGKNGYVGRLKDAQTGLQLTMDEFDRFLGFSPIVKELMRRVNLGGDKKIGGGNRNSSHPERGDKSSKSGGRKRGSWLKNIKFVASSVTGLISDKERDNIVSPSPAVGGIKSPSLSGNSSDWLKVHQHGKSHKELTGLYMSQDIQAHLGSIWCMKFSSDGRFLASAGEDRTVHVWKVMESDTLSTFSSLQHQESHLSAGISATSVLAVNGPVSSRMDQASILAAHASKRTGKQRKLGSRRHSLPDYIVLPETIFSISESPTCSFKGHLDDVLDLSWSKSQHLLSSSMDKTVRLWDTESNACLKLFAHNDYVTCIQFNPIDENYFISGSLDGKVRIWSIPNRQVVDWSDLHEMVTAVCYAPDGQGALVGSHKGSFRFYKTLDDRISQESQIDNRYKKKKSHAKKITGFQYAPDSPSHVMVTSADSQIRIFDGVNVIHKFRGFRNSGSQISASFSSDGKYVICASEDSNVYVWKHDAARHGGSAAGKRKGWLTTRSHEYFYCKDVSVAIPWPNVGSSCEKPVIPSQSLSSFEDMFPSIRSNCPSPPLPANKCSLEQMLLPSSPDVLQTSSSSSRSFGSWGWGGGSNRVAASGRESCRESANAWGLVVVTAGLGGSIKVYQNFGLPVRLSRQSNLF